VDKQAEFRDINSQSRQLKVGDAASATSKEAMLLRLAKKQGMNTDIRRKIFVAVMSSEVR
jgi:nucleolar MIF4G domain-containing protein 1